MKNFYLRIALVMVAVSLNLSAFAQVAISGTVVDAANGDPIIGANIIIKGTTVGTVTDFDGNFNLSAPEGSVIQISYMGYESVEKEAQASMIIKLGENTELLEEVMVVGYGTVKKNDATGSVTAIKPDEMNKGLTTNAQQMLSGKIAGVSVIDNGGMPGGGASIRIRGGSSLSASNDPLIVIDGLAMDNGGIPGAANPLSMVNPSDIETFTVLKDASATAIYGSRASNGVIIITTKKGTAGQKMKVTYDGNVSVGTLTNRIQTLTGDEVRRYATALGHTTEAMAFLGTENTDWQDQVYRTAVSTDHNISLMGGVKNDKVSMPYRASLGYTLQNGTIKTSQMQRVTASLNLNPSFLDDHLIFNLNAKGMYIYNSYAPDIVGSALSMDPTQPVRGGATSIYGAASPTQAEVEALFGGYFQPTQPATYYDPAWPLKQKDNCTYNPLAALNQKSSKANSGVFVGNLEATYKVHGLEDLLFHANFGADYSYGKQNYDNSCYGTDSHYYGYNGYDIKHKYNLQFNAYAQYGHDWKAARQHFDIMAGYEWQHFYNDKFNEGSGFYQATNNDPTKVQVVYDKNGRSSIVGIPANFSTSSFKTQSYLVSFFGRMNYIGWDQLMITATVRGDGSSRFAPEHRWGVFPSVALGWKMKETFMPDQNVCNDLKLRLGWGITGQQEINQGDYPYMATYTTTKNYGAYYPVGGEENYAKEDKDGNTLNTENGQYVKDLNGNILYSSYRPNAYNRDLTWEKTTTYNAGLDYGFLNNRINGSIDYYYRKTDDLLNTVPCAVGTNFRNRVIANVGSLVNQGVEFAINAVILDFGKKFKWDFGYNITYNQNKITKLTTGETQTPIPTGGISSGTGNTIQQHAVGRPLASFYVYETQKTTLEDGSQVYYVVDRYNDGTIDERDKYYYHNPAAPVQMGFQMKFQFYGFDLGMSFRSHIGNYVYNDVKANNLQYIESSKFNKDGYYHGLLTQCFDTYWKDGMKSDNIYKQAADGKFQPGFSEWFRTDYFVENASFLRCDNITLGYSFAPKNAKVSGRAFCTVSNPFVISKYSGLDPEVNGGIDNNIYPRCMTTVIGINLQF